MLSELQTYSHSLDVRVSWKMPDKGQSPEHGRLEPPPSDSHPSFLVVSTVKVPSPSPTDPNHHETNCFGDLTYGISHDAALS